MLTNWKAPGPNPWKVRLRLNAASAIGADMASPGSDDPGRIRGSI